MGLKHPFPLWRITRKTETYNTKVRFFYTISFVIQYKSRGKGTFKNDNCNQCSGLVFKKKQKTNVWLGLKIILSLEEAALVPD